MYMLKNCRSMKPTPNLGVEHQLFKNVQITTAKNKNRIIIISAVGRPLLDTSTDFHSSRLDAAWIHREAAALTRSSVYHVGGKWKYYATLF